MNLLLATLKIVAEYYLGRLFHAFVIDPPSLFSYLWKICLWVYLWFDDNSVVEFIGKIFIAAVSFVVALGFLVYGGRLFFMLRRFPIESKGRRKKLHEVESVTAICFTCFLIRCFVDVLSGFDEDATLDVLEFGSSCFECDIVHGSLPSLLTFKLLSFIIWYFPFKFATVSSAAGWMLLMYWSI